jgi:hypothetical protein
MGAAAKGAWLTAVLLVSAGCAQCGWQQPADVPTAMEQVDYGPNPLADCLHWPADAPRVVPLYAP